MLGESSSCIKKEGGACENANGTAESLGVKESDDPSFDSFFLDWCTLQVPCLCGIFVDHMVVKLTRPQSWYTVTVDGYRSRCTSK